MRDKNLELSNFGSQNNHIHDCLKKHENFRICEIFVRLMTKTFLGND
jgi:hypothetical protein